MSCRSTIVALARQRTIITIGTTRWGILSLSAGVAKALMQSSQSQLGTTTARHVASSECDLASLDALQSRLRIFIERQQQETGRGQTTMATKLCVVVAGGGSSFLSSLASTPGASSILTEGTLTYGRTSFQDYLLRNNKGITLSLENENDSGNDDTYKYCSSQAATDLARAACQRSVALAEKEEEADTAETADMAAAAAEELWAVGVSCTSVLQSKTSRSFGTRGSRAYVSVQSSGSAAAVHMEATLSGTAGRSRVDEDVVCGALILSALELWFLSKKVDNPSLSLPGVKMTLMSSDADDPSSASRERTLRGETSLGDAMHVTIVKDRNDAGDSNGVDAVVRQGAEQILSGTSDVTVLLPKSNSVAVLESNVLPPNILVFPGSFNPPHVGHIALAKAAASSMTKCDSVFFELSITNVDKPALKVDEVIARVRLFLSLQQDLPDSFRWGILLTNAPMFKQKVDLVSPMLQQPGIHFCIGTDTLVRLIDPKYYNNSKEEMLKILQEMPCNFVVGGRLEQRTSSDPTFVSGKDDIKELPSDVQSKFLILDGFRVDVSSTEIRKQMAESQNQ